MHYHGTNLEPKSYIFYEGDKLILSYEGLIWGNLSFLLNLKLSNNVQLKDFPINLEAGNFKFEAKFCKLVGIISWS